MAGVVGAAGRSRWRSSTASRERMLAWRTSRGEAERARIALELRRGGMGNVRLDRRRSTRGPTPAASTRCWSSSSMSSDRPNDARSPAADRPPASETGLSRARPDRSRGSALLDALERHRPGWRAITPTGPRPTPSPRRSSWAWSGSAPRRFARLRGCTSVGMVYVPGRVLAKPPGELTPEERELLDSRLASGGRACARRGHPRAGVRVDRRDSGALRRRRAAGPAPASGSRSSRGSCALPVRFDAVVAAPAKAPPGASPHAPPAGGRRRARRRRRACWPRSSTTSAPPTTARSHASCARRRPDRIGAPCARSSPRPTRRSSPSCSELREPGDPLRLRRGGGKAAREGQANRARAGRQAARPGLVRGARHVRAPPHLRVRHAEAPSLRRRRGDRLGHDRRPAGVRLLAGLHRLRRLARRGDGGEDVQGHGPGRQDRLRR